MEILPDTNRLELLSNSLDDPLESLKKLESYIKTQPVVDIKVARRLAAWCNSLRGDDLIASLTVQMCLMDHWFFMYFGCEVLDFIASRRPRGGRSREDNIKRISKEIAANGYFRQLNQRTRRYYAGAAPVPTADVRAHIRDGRRVRSHVRFLGYNHLLELPLTEYPEFVGRVVRVLSLLRKYRASLY